MRMIQLNAMCVALLWMFYIFILNFTYEKPHNIFESLSNTSQYLWAFEAHKT